MIPYILTDNSLTIVVDGKAKTMEKSNPSFGKATGLLMRSPVALPNDGFDFSIVLALPSTTIVNELSVNI